MNATDDPALLCFERLFGPEFGHGKKFDLTRLNCVLGALGDPHLRLAPVFHVAGTNGKGSTIAFVRAILEADGRRAHIFTKPNLLTLRERFTIASAPAKDDALIEAAERVAAAGEGLTQFEAQAAVAFLMFSESDADVCLIETGMGGRDDATNVIASPVASVITSIGLDHQDALGVSIADIARHKAGIIKAGAPAVVARQDAEAREILADEASKVGAPLYAQGEAWDAFASNGRLVVQTEARALDLPLPALSGAHQIDNAGLAVAALLLAPPFEISEAAFAEGVASARWPGRLTPLTKGVLAHPVLDAGGEVWIDGGHNAHAGAALARWARDMKKRRPAPLIAIIGMRARKDWLGFVATLAPEADLVIAVSLGGESADPRALAEAANGEVADSLNAAMERAAQFPAPRVLISGSLLLAGAALSAG